MQYVHQISLWFDLLQTSDTIHNLCPEERDKCGVYGGSLSQDTHNHARMK